MNDDGKPVRYRLSCQKLNLTPATHTHDQALEAILRYYGMSDVPVPGTETLEWLQKHFPDRMRRDGLRESTMDNYQYSLNHLIAIKGKNTRINEITRADIDAYKAYLFAKGLRHAFATLALRYESVWRTRAHMGHSKVQTTQGYAHTDVDDGKHIDIEVDISKHWKSKKTEL